METTPEKLATAILDRMTNYADIFAIGLRNGKDQLDLMNIAKKGFMKTYKVNEVRAANMVRLMVEITSRKYFGEIKYTDKEVTTITRLAFSA